MYSKIKSFVSGNLVYIIPAVVTLAATCAVDIACAVVTRGNLNWIQTMVAMF